MTMTELQELRHTYRQRKAELLAALKSSGSSTRSLHATLHKLASLADGLLAALWQGADFDQPLALLAVGGYGRGELFPNSDVDVLLLLPNSVVLEDSPTLKARIESFIGSCWDAGLEIGSSVRTLAECVAEAAKDVTVQTSLLESRLVVGSASLFAEFQVRFDTLLNPHAFFVAKTLEMRQRHTKHENTPYALEPNCKESPGGLRDLQVILWLTKAAGLGKNWDELVRKGLLTSFEASQIKQNEALLSLIRSRLHLLANRREDRLVFDLQAAVAESFGYAHQTTADGRIALRASEVLMRRYYWAAKAVTQLNQIALLNIEERLQTLKGGHPHALRPINERFFEKAGMIEVASDDLYTKHPHAILETFLIYQTHLGLRGLSARTLRALYNSRNVMDSAFRHDPANRSTFLRILQQPAGITRAVRLMNQTSVLGRYLWVFRRIVGQMQHDLFHVYTVDQHILMVLRNMRRFFMAEHAHEYPFCSQLAAGWDKPWVLYVAAMFHDIAKGRGGNHSDLGRTEVRRFCREHGINRADSKLIEFLVGEHLTMSHVAQKSDLSNPNVIHNFAQRVGNERNLTALYLLTVADVRGTSPKVWNAWKGKLLEDLYRYTLRALGGRAPDPCAEVEARKREALVLLALHAEPFEGHKALWDTLDVSYFMRHDAADIAWHARQLARHVAVPSPRPSAMPTTAAPQDDNPEPEVSALPEPASPPVDAQPSPASAPATRPRAIVRARLSPVGEGLQVVVYTPDQPDLFARICGYFDQASFSILDAKVHTNRNGYALDTFQIVTSMLPDHYRELISMVETGLALSLDQRTELPNACASRGRVSRRVKNFPYPPQIDLRPDEKAQRWLLTISASDRVGLLYGIACVLGRHHINLHLAKVTTLGERVEDTFLIDGPALQHNRDQIQIETELLEVLGG
jgi:[protein-PII] uridylyltransferase